MYAKLTNEVWKIKLRRDTLIGLVILTVAIAFPAYIGRLNISELSTEITSDRGEESKTAAARGRKFFPLFDDGARTWVKDFDKCTKRLEISSAGRWAQSELSATSTFETLLTLAACVAAFFTSVPNSSTDIFVQYSNIEIIKNILSWLPNCKNTYLPSNFWGSEYCR